MHLDIETLGFILFLIYLGNTVLSALLALSGRTFQGAWLWVSAQGLMALGALLVYLRPLEAPWVLVLGNGLLVTSCLPFAHAIWSFRFELPFPKLLYAIVPLVVLSLWLVAGQPFSTRVVVVSSWLTVGSFLPALLLLRGVERRYRLANHLTALPFLVTSAASLVRLVWNGFFPAPEEYLTQQGGNGWYMVGAMVISTVTLFGYFMMTAVRAEQVVGLKDEAIEARNHKLIESGRAKDLFFSIIAHDLRGPIGGAARYVRKHLMGKMTGLESKYPEVEVLASALEKTNEFLEKLLWWSRAQLQDWTPILGPVDLSRTFDHALSLARSSADLKEITLELAPGPYPRPLADPESVQLILGNLLSNAVKFSLPGHPIRITTGEENGLCRITVEDHGVGMDAATLDRLFHIEDKLSTHGTKGERGSGMGLLLAQSLAERNRGGVAIESDPGVGTRATLWLPIQDSESPR